MSDAIFVNGLVLHAYHGVMPHEAKVGQPFKLDLVLDIDLSAASRSDTLKDTISYETLVKIVSEAFCTRRYRLVEAAAGAVNTPGPATDPYDDAIAIGREAVRKGAREAEGFAHAFASVVHAGHRGDRRVILDSRSVAAQD